MNKFDKIIYIVLKILFALPINLLFALLIFFFIEDYINSHTIEIFYSLLILFFGIITIYTNWAIWTKGKKKKIILAIIYLLLLLIAFLTIAGGGD